MGYIGKITLPFVVLHSGCEVDGTKCPGCPVRFERRTFSPKKGKELYLLYPETEKVLYFSNSGVEVPESTKSGFICLSGMEDVKVMFSASIIP